MGLPTIKTLQERLEISKEQALQVRQILEKYSSGDKALQAIDKLFDWTFGVEVLRDNGWSAYYCDIGMEYLNSGDMYTPTIMYDTRSGNYRVGCLGDILESQTGQKRFAGC